MNVVYPENGSLGDVGGKGTAAEQHAWSEFKQSRDRESMAILSYLICFSTSMTSFKLKVIQPSDFHVHLRQGDFASLVVPHVRQGGFGLAYVMVRLGECGSSLIV